MTFQGTDEQLVNALRETAARLSGAKAAICEAAAERLSQSALDEPAQVGVVIFRKGISKETVIRAAQRYHAQAAREVDPTTGWEGEEKLTVEEAWTILCETPDITSPEDYPDHALITMEQLGSFMARANPIKATEGHQPRCGVIGWPPLKKAIWDEVIASNLNDGKYISAWELTDRLYAAALKSSGTSLSEEVER